MPEGGTVIEGLTDIDRSGRKNGVAALDPIVKFWKRPGIDPAERLIEEVEGVVLVPVEEIMTRLLEERDLWTFSFYGTIQEAETRLEAGVPLLVMVQDNPMNVDSRRYMILFGFNRNAEKLVAMEGGPYPGVYTYQAFRRIWRPVRNWVKVACPPERITWPIRTLEQITLARYREKKGDWQIALRDYEKAGVLDPSNEEIMLARARIMYESGDTLGAIVQYRRVLDRSEFNATAANNLAYILLSNDGSLAESERLVRRALTIEPSNPAYLDTLGLTLIRAGRPGEAAQILSRARHRADSMPRKEQRKITHRLITAYVDSNQLHLARQTYLDQQRNDPEFMLPDDLARVLHPPPVE